MGKQKHKNKNNSNKNVFKVAGARSLKMKNKAKAVTHQLKKLNEVTRKKVVEVDGQLSTLQEEVRKSQKSAKHETVTIKQQETVVVDTSEAMNKLSEMQMKSSL